MFKSHQDRSLRRKSPQVNNISRSSSSIKNQSPSIKNLMIDAYKKKAEKLREYRCKFIKKFLPLPVY